MASAPRVEAGDWFALPRGAVSPRPLYAIGDIHGCTEALEAVHGVLRALAKGGGLLVYLGDYVDRGRDSPGALSMVRAGPGIEGLDVVALRGNHDQYLIDGAGLEGSVSTRTFENWLAYGGETTFDDLGVDPALDAETRGFALAKALGEERADFLRSTILHHREGAIVFAHAGLNPGRLYAEQTARDFMWVREPFLECQAEDWPFEGIVVHGHTPYAFGVDHHRIGVDSRCFSTGVLTLLEMRGARGRFHRVSA